MLATVALMVENKSISSRNSDDVMITLGNMYHNMVNLTDDTVERLNKQGDIFAKIATFPD